MSYVCLAVSKQGAAAAGDTRITLHFPLPFIHLFYDDGQKVFSSENGQTIWAFTGITFWFFWNYPRMVKKIMKKEELPLEERLEQVITLMCRHTKAPLLYRLPLIRRLPFVKKSSFAKGFTFNLLYAQNTPDSPETPPVCGALCIQNGALFSRKSYEAPVIIENGMNYKSLTPLQAFCPAADMDPYHLQDLTIRRVWESIQKDRELKAKNKRYVATIGGNILSRTLTSNKRS